MIERYHIPESNRLFSVSQSREADRRTIDEFGIDGFTLMEQAAAGASDIIRREAGTNKSGLFISGKGNNGGDSLAVARYLTERAAHSADIWFCMGNENLSPDASKNFSLLKKLIEHGSGIRILEQNPFESRDVFKYDYIVDGIFGSGLTDDVREPVSSVIRQMNETELPIYSMDIPSGLNADTGLVQGIGVKSTVTITLGTLKTGFYLNNAARYTGDVQLVLLPFPEYCLTYDSVVINHKLDSFFPEIERVAEHKYDDGVVHILAGSKGLTGAAIMAAKSAWKAGAGAVILYTTENLLPIYEKNLPQIIKKVIGGPSDDQFMPGHAEEVISYIDQKPGVLLAGPGMGTDEPAQKMLEEVLRRQTGKIILDADGLSGFEALKKLPSEKRNNWLLTPHIGEATGYLGMKFDKENDHERLNIVKEYSEKFECSILLKGNPTFLIHYDGKSYITGYDTTPFSRAGFGDVLSGTIAANLGITGNCPVSVVRALLTGHTKYHQLAEDEVFGPEHLT